MVTIIFPEDARLWAIKDESQQSESKTKRKQNKAEIHASEMDVSRDINILKGSKMNKSWYNNEDFLAMIQNEINTHCLVNINNATSNKYQNELLTIHMANRGMTRQDRYKQYWKLFKERYKHLENDELQSFVKDLRRLLRNRNK